MMWHFIAYLIILALMIPAFAYVDWLWFRRIRDMFDDVGVARKICDERRDQGLRTFTVSWFDVGIRPKSPYFRRLTYVSVAEDSSLPVAESVGLAGFVAFQLLICTGFIAAL